MNLLDTIKENLAKVWREPMLFVVAATSLATLILNQWDQVAVFLNWAHVPATYQTALINVATAIIAVVAWLNGRVFTTPMRDPRDESGNPLVPEAYG